MRESRGRHAEIARAGLNHAPGFLKRDCLDVPGMSGGLLPFTVFLHDHWHSKSYGQQRRSANNPDRLSEITGGDVTLVHQQPAKAQKEESEDNTQFVAHGRVLFMV